MTYFPDDLKSDVEARVLEVPGVALNGVNQLSAKVSPILRWAGSKKRSLPAMRPYLPQQMRGKYIEVFAGSACLFFDVAPANAVLSDTNRDLVHFYQQVISDPIRIYDEFSKISRDRETYYRIRTSGFQDEQGISGAAKFLYLNRNCFNGIFRTNTLGNFNVPFSDRRVSPYPTESEFLEAARLLTCAVVVCQDFQHTCFRYIEDGDFVYLDPPYYVPQQRVFREYSAKPFSPADVDRLKETLTEIDRRGAQFLLSYPLCSLMEPLARVWNSAIIRVRRTIAGAASSRGNAEELILSNY